MHNQQIKKQVHDYWNKASCGTEYILQQKYSRAYFCAIEEHRYTIEPEIHAFAQFSRFHGKKVLEVGVGAGTDFVQWVRSGALAYGIDLTQEAINNTTRCLALYDLQAQEVKVADAEHLPYEDNFFDVTYFLNCLIQFQKRSLFLGLSICLPAGLNILLNILLIPCYQLHGCVLATLISYATYFIITYAYNLWLLK